MKVEIDEFPDGALCLSCGNKGMESDLVFSSGAFIKEDPVLVDQRKILEYIVEAVNFYKTRSDR
jgi:hypothetical protein